MVLIREHYSSEKTKFIATFKIKKHGYANFINIKIKVFALDAYEAEKKARKQINARKDLKFGKLLYIENTATGDIT